MLKNSIVKIREKSQAPVHIDVWTEHIQENQKLCDDDNLNIVEFIPWKFPIVILRILLVNLICRKTCVGSQAKGILGSIYHADLFFDISGISFLDERNATFLLYDTLIALPAILLKKPIIKASQALGPFHNPLNKILASFILPRITWIYARGKETLSSLQQFGLKNISLAADIGFYDESLFVAKPLDSMGHSRRPIIGISVSSVVWSKCQKMGIDYVKVLNEFIQYLLTTHEASIILIPHAIKYDGKMRNNDIPVIEQILVTSQSEHVYFFKEMEHPYELRQLIATCDFLFASRFHAMISSLSVGVPVIILGWSHKYREVLDLFDLPDCFITFKDLNVENVIRVFERLFPQRASLAKNLTSKIEDVRTLADVNFFRIPEFLSDGKLIRK